MIQVNPYIQPDWANSCLITIDLQNDTLDGQTLEVPGTTAALPNVRAVLDQFRIIKKPIIHVIRLYKSDGSNADLCRKLQIEQGNSFFIPGEHGAELAAPLFAEEHTLDTELLLEGKVQPVSSHEWIMYKPRWGAFYQTQLEEFLRSKGINTLVFTGCNFPNCPRTSMYEASERDFKVVLIQDAISGLYEKGAAELKNIGVHLINTQDIAGILGGR
jgi:nicotinamidase-related amidase